jgi:aspartate-semialdehyde dehydrogenase
LKARADLLRAGAFLLVPVSEDHQEGPQALHDQTVALLSMKPIPEEIFPQQRAFNLLPRGPLPRLEQETAEILGLPDGTVWAAAASSPVFIGYGLAIWVELDVPLEPRAAGELLAESGLILAEPGGSGPVEATEAEEMRVAHPQGAPGRLWLWAAFEAAASGNLDNAVDLARCLIEGGEK